MSSAPVRAPVADHLLAFSSLLLPGGRLADLLSRKVMFLAGLAGFAGVSAIGGARTVGDACWSDLSGRLW